MREQNLKKIAITNLKTALLAQFISLAVNVIMSLLVPKQLNIKEFAYWQLFLFYANYVGFFLFGLNDGIYLRLGGMDYKKIDKDLLGTQFKIALIFQIVIAFGVFFLAVNFIQDHSRVAVFLRLAIYTVIFNMHGYLGYILQSVNQTKDYSISLLFEKLTFVSIIIFLLFVRTNSFIYFVDGYILCKFVSFIYVAYCSKEIVFSKLIGISRALYEMALNIKVGINLMLANISNSLILGIGRMMIDKKWDVITFGKVSLSLSLVNFFLMFINQLSMVLFPALRRIERSQLIKIYHLIRNLMGFTVSSVFIFYIPVKLIICWWLPQYVDSVRYLVFLLPICTYESKMNVICNTYFKVLRMEKKLFCVNFMSMILSFITVMVTSIIFHNLYAVLISMTFSISFRCIISETILAYKLNTDIKRSIIQEFILATIFIISTISFNNTAAFITQILMYIVYILLNIKELKKCLYIVIGGKLN